MIQVKISCNFVCSNLKDLFHFSNAYCLNIQAGHETQNYVLFILVGTSGIQLILALASFNHVCKLLKLVTVLSQLNPIRTFEDVNQKTQAFFSFMEQTQSWTLLQDIRNRKPEGTSNSRDFARKDICQRKNSKVKKLFLQRV